MNKRLETALVAAELAFRYAEKGHNLEATLIYIERVFSTPNEVTKTRRTFK